MRMSIEDARNAVLAAVGDFGALDRALDDLVTAVREHSAGIVRGMKPRDPDNEADEAMAWALDITAVAVKRGYR